MLELLDANTPTLKPSSPPISTCCLAPLKLPFLGHICGAIIMNLPWDLSWLQHHLVPLLAVLVAAVVYLFGFSKRKSHLASVRNTPVGKSKDVKKAGPRIAHLKSTQWYRDMFFQLQNLEDHPETLEPAREELLTMFSRALSLALRQVECDSSSNILSIEDYSVEGISTFLKHTHQKTQSEFASYLERRKQGEDTELFGTAEAAKDWLVQQAPIKLVDGAWLGHVNKITTLFSLRGVTRQLWHLLSEELGDGDLSKNHVNLYHRLLNDIGCPLPNGHSADFIRLPEWNRVENREAWQAAVGQLTISLFPNEFLPEILGFNMHFETVTLDTMQAAHELKCFAIDPYYFLIHITIDNADSGHTAIAAHAVMEYLEVVRATEGEEAVQQAWKRVQVGYILSQTLGSHSSPGTVNLGLSSPEVLLGPLSTQVMDILRSKALVSDGIHSQSRTRIGPYTLSEWLDADLWKHANGLHQLDLLTALSEAKPWVFAGESSKSLLLRELSWGGRMFGAFTNNEVATLRSWIDALRPKDEPLLYWKFTQRQFVTSQDAVAALRDSVHHYQSVFPDNEAQMLQAADSCIPTMCQRLDSVVSVPPWKEQSRLNTPSMDQLPDIIALWFAHISLLENTTSIPSRTVCPLYSCILRLLRAQAGFDIESDIVAGMDELRRESCTSLVDIGLELVQKLGHPTIGAKPSCLHDVLLLAAKHGQSEDSARLANNMLRWSARPTGNLGLLLGIALAFLEFKYAILRAPDLLDRENCFLLEAIVTREKTSLEECAGDLQNTGDTRYKDLLQGYHLAMTGLSKCL
ncbi:hypothetical protein N7495_001957 [Penicillium taxi]|uniref:uncharacterized protein n=1 Tax=Penicillium taxi TaxID=168475 RepID=UPI002544E79C|nr:uncharacterized protein N7495_001957 [Penicillium taxi]KAJ5909275.1 hypothetical protein N7495_001957 [Penicillium taxi]